MSFRKRSEVLNRGVGQPSGVPGRTPTNSLRAPIGMQRSIDGAPRGIGRAPVGRSVPDSTVPNLNNLSLRNNNPAGLQGSDISPESELIENHPGVRPSPATSHPTTSTGCFDLDKLLLHSGLPLGNTLLLEEMGSTEFNSIISKLFIAQGVVYNRTEPTKNNTHTILVSLNHGLAKDIPGIYKGSKRDIKKSKISEEESKVTVQNITGHSSAQRSRDLKIAWRYGLNDKKDADAEESAPVGDYKNYNHQFDITTRLMPLPTSTDITFISPAQPIKTILSKLLETIEKHPKKLIRIVIPSLLHPAMYPPNMFKLQNIIPFLHGIRSTVKQYSQRSVLLTTLSSDILDPIIISQMENLFDSVIVLEPFEQEMLQFLERAYKTQPNKVQHGLVHIKKRAIFSDFGEMHVVKSEWAFKNGRKKFEIEEWGIPVEDEDAESAKKDKTDDVLNTVDLNVPSSHGDHDHNHSSTSNTKIGIDF
ncbi:hypothetical protein TPHA_0I01710 [Tetrapisispora phaffii CBS 4417]|uniref:Elongator complex protein 4 n=1 Tax=Tetrapisispora phaffii (strain ATCC 24235 / CBS 4417 / NBRC 1672 / NRRL Y-8282 / UCD 70-5) TaxID=1071381 RepID=G8BXP7_TETPH|nr:hypothetical protein TPHA_0I01710 [Tetrapisispora phaffii CBS 4417]CCE64675.1 hypothetical protein TPHA_0I01710 [Tetrapisispora phaffii CBS 4417]